MVQIINDNIELIAVILEIASFFMVTIDLYGKDRLLKVEKRIINSSSDNQNSKPMKIVSIGFMIIFFIPYILLFNKVLTISGTVAQIGLCYSFNLVLALILLIFSLTFSISMFFGSYKKVSLIVVRLGVFILKKLKLEGFLLYAGTGLFLLSKLATLLAL